MKRAKMFANRLVAFLVKKLRWTKRRRGSCTTPAESEEPIYENLRISDDSEDYFESSALGCASSTNASDSGFIERDCDCANDDRESLTSSEIYGGFDDEEHQQTFAIVEYRMSSPIEGQMPYILRDPSNCTLYELYGDFTDDEDEQEFVDGIGEGTHAMR